MQANGVTGPRSPATVLNERDVRTARGGAWHNSKVRDLLARRLRQQSLAVIGLKCSR